MQRERRRSQFERRNDGLARSVLTEFKDIPFQAKTHINNCVSHADVRQAGVFYNMPLPMLCKSVGFIRSTRAYSWCKMLASDKYKVVWLGS